MQRNGVMLSVARAKRCIQLPPEQQDAFQEYGLASYFLAWCCYGLLRFHLRRLPDEKRKIHIS